MIPGFSNQRAGNFNDDFKIHINIKEIFSLSKKNSVISFFLQPCI